MLNELLNRGRKSTPAINSIKHNNMTFSDDTDISNAFNDLFSTVGNKLGESISSKIDPRRFMNASNVNTIFLSPTTDDEIFKGILSLKDGKSPGIDEITPKILKCISHTIVPI